MTSTSEKPTEHELVARASKALVDGLKSYYSTNARGSSSTVELFPDYSLSKVLELVRNDSITWGAITTLVDRAIESGWVVKDKKGKTRKDVMRLLRGKGFDFWLRELLTHYFVFNNAFGELVYTPSGNVKELHTLDPTQTKIQTNVHGEVDFYYQEHTGQNIRWSPEEVLFITDPNLGMNVWGEVSLKTIWQAILVKYNIKKFILWLFETNQFRGVFNLESIDAEAVKRFLLYMKQSEKDITKPIVVEGQLKYFLQRDMKDLKLLNDLMYKMDEEILNLLQVPPIYAGLPDNSNRSNSEAQERAFDTRIRSIHSLFELKINELLKRMNISGVEFVFKPLSVKNEKQVFETAQIMRSMGMKDTVIAAYLREKGIELPTGMLFDKNQQQDGDAKKLLTEAQAPSRQRKGTDQPNEKIGVGTESTTREEQLVGKTTAFNTYPYVYDVKDNAL